MKLEARINYIAFIVIGIIFILVGQALNEIEIIKIANLNSVNRGNNLDKWYEFLKPYIGDRDNGLPPPFPK